MGQAYEHGILDLAAGVDVAGQLDHPLFEREGIEAGLLQGCDLVGREFCTKAPFRPAAGAPKAEVRGEKPSPIGKVDPVNGVSRSVLKVLGHPVAAHLAEFAIVDGELPAGIGERRQRRPVPLVLILAGREILLDRLVNQRLGVANGLVDGQALRLLGRHAAEVGAIQFAAELPAGPRGKGLAAVVFIEEGTDVLVDLAVDHLENHLPAVGIVIGLVEDLLPKAIDPLPLLVHHFVVFEEVLADLEVSLLHLLLRGLDAAGHHPALDRLAVLHAESREHVLHPLAGEDPHQVVFEREEEAARARIPLAAAAAAELQIDPPRLVPLGADDLQAPHAADGLAFGLHVLAVGDLGDECLPLGPGNVEPCGVGVLELGPGQGVGVAAEDDVGAAARHVGGDRDGGHPAGLSHDLGLPLVVLGVEHLVVHAPLLQERREPFALLDRDGADEHGQPLSLNLLDLRAGNPFAGPLPLGLELDLAIEIPGDPPQLPGAVGEGDSVPAVDPLHLVGHRDPLLTLRAVDHVGMIDSLHAAVGRDRDHVELVDLPELGRLGHGGARHAADLPVELEKVLERDGGERLRLLLDPHPFLGLDGLVEAVGPLPARHQAAGKLVDDHHLPLLNHVVDVPLVEVVGLERVVDEVWPLHIAGRVEALDAGDFLREPHTLLGQGDSVLLLLDLEVLLGQQLPGDLIGPRVLRDIVMGWAGDDQRRPRLVDEDVVDLVDDRVVERPLSLLHVLREAVVAPRSRPHVVAEIVKPELVVGAIRDVTVVGFLPLSRLHARLDRAHGQAEAQVERPHPLHVAAGKIVVHGDDVHALAVERVEIGGQGGDQRLALAGDHLGDRPGVEHHAADQLHVVVPHAEKATPPFAADGEGLHEEVVECLAGRQPPPEVRRLAAEFRVAHRLVRRLQGVDRLDLGFHPTEVTGVGRAEQAGEESLQPGAGSGGAVRDRIPEAFEDFHK